MQELAGLAVEQVEERVSIGERQDLALAVIEFCVQQDRDLVRVPVMGIVRRELEVPLQGAGFGVERDHGAGIQVVAGPDVAVPVGRRIADRPVEEVELRVERTGQPGRTATGLPGVILPGLAAGVAGRRNRVEAPDPLAGCRVIGIDESADARLRAADADDDLVVYRERRQGQGKADIVVGHLDVPANGAGGRVEGDQMRVERADIDGVVKDRNAAIHARETDVLDVVRHVGRPGPQGFAGAGIERRNRTGRLRDVHDPVDDDRRGLHQAVAGLRRRLHLVGPDDLQIADIVPVDLVERRETLGSIGAGIRQPVVGIRRRIDEPLVAHLRVGLHSEHHQYCRDPFHCSLLRLIM